jgi:hypothetical protein
MSDMFQGNVSEVWTGAGGNWQVVEAAELDDIQRQIIYRSPEEPSHVAWVGIWQNSAGDIYLRFPQISGNPGLDPSYGPWYGRHRFPIPGMRDWDEFVSKHHLLPGPDDALSSTVLHYITLVSHDQGETWQTASAVPVELLDDEAGRGNNQRLVLASTGELVGSGMSIIRCRDGRIVESLWALESAAQREQGRSLVIGLRQSHDEGRTWTPEQLLQGRFEDGREVVEATEENALLELADGRLLALIRSGGQQHVLLAWLSRDTGGEYRLDGPVVVSDLPHAGMPNLVQTADGVIWYWGEKHYYSLDQGRTWSSPPESQRINSYYGKMLSVAGNGVLCVTQGGVYDSPYPCTNDGRVEQVRFTSRRYGILKQTDRSSVQALFRLRHGVFQDLHLRVDMRPDRADGVAFCIADDGGAFFAALVVLPDNPEYARWLPAPVQGATLSAFFPGLADEHVRERIESGAIKVDPRPMFVLARIEGDRAEILRGLMLGESIITAASGSAIRVQVRIQGDLIQAACRVNSQEPVYLGVRDPRAARGGVGVLTADGSQGEFRSFAVQDAPVMMRDCWDD